jgi:hypothetical protein
MENVSEWSRSNGILMTEAVSEPQFKPLDEDQVQIPDEV